MRAVFLLLGLIIGGSTSAVAQTVSPAIDVEPSNKPDLPDLPDPSNPSDLIRLERKDDAAAVEAAKASDAIDPVTNETTLGGAKASGTPDGGAVDTTGMSPAAAAAASEDTPSEGIVPGQESSGNGN